MTRQHVVVAGALANKPANGGEAWVRLSWIRGLQQLGCDVWFIEEIEGRHCPDGHDRTVPFHQSTNLQWFRDVTKEFGVTDRAWLMCDDGQVEGPSSTCPRDVAADALLVNISGHLRDESLKRAFRWRAYVDIDPGFTQIWHAQGDGARLAGHDIHFTIGANIGSNHCPIPTVGREWHHVRPPTVLADWPQVARPASMESSQEIAPFFTTVATWRGPFGPLHLDRRRFGLKVHEFRKFIALPRRVDESFEAALAIHPSEVVDLQLLEANGWRLADPTL